MQFIHRTLNHAVATNRVFPVSDHENAKDKMLNWAQQFNIFCLLDNHRYNNYPHTFECVLAAGCVDYIRADAGNAIEELQEYISNKNSWLFGHIGYDLKNEIEELSSSHPDRIQFPDLFFFEPQFLIRLNEDEMTIEGSSNPEKIFASIINTSSTLSSSETNIYIQQRIHKEKYFDTVTQLKKHIQRGDCYEINFCQEFFAEDVSLDPVSVYKKLSSVSPNPFSALYKLHNKFLVCASPERFLYKRGKKIISQPMKGTSKRVLLDKAEDSFSKYALYESAKDRSENAMVVDVVRNDLSKLCKEGKVKVDELYGIYSFPQVHQMISTISGELKDDVSFADIIRATFPMGSMTGAPKKRVMELIEKYEATKRGIYSGALGYITPSGDFDFNVVIRSMMYNKADKYLSFQAGSGITHYSDPGNEWEECLLKAQAIKNVLTS